MRSFDLSALALRESEDEVRKLQGAIAAFKIAFPPLSCSHEHGGSRTRVKTTNRKTCASTSKARYRATSLCVPLATSCKPPAATHPRLVGFAPQETRAFDLAGCSR